MAKNREIGELGQIVTVDTSANSMTVNGSIIVGNSSSNVVVNSTAISFGGITQTDKSYTWTNTHNFTNTVYIAALSANGTYGNSGDVLFSNGSAVYWAEDSTVQGNFPVGDLGNIINSQDSFGVRIVTLITFDCAFAGAIVNTDLGTTGSI